MKAFQVSMAASVRRATSTGRNIRLLRVQHPIAMFVPHSTLASAFHVLAPELVFAAAAKCRPKQDSEKGKAVDAFCKRLHTLAS